MLKKIFGSLARHAATSIGGIIAALGFASGSDAEKIGGALSVLVGAIASLVKAINDAKKEPAK